jgi:uncharacterized protein YodC (DUF2158 family)
MPQEFKVGDTVQLKSGGPNMTVTKLPDPEGFGELGDGEVNCMWFAGAKRERGSFPPEALVPVTDGKK